MPALLRVARIIVFLFGTHYLIAPANAVAQVTPATNFQGLWWAAPAGSESGWGINFAHQGDVIFATWFTYDTQGNAIWWSMTAHQVALGVFTGMLVETWGPPVTTTPFEPNDVKLATNPGEATLTFTSATTGTFETRMGGVNQTKAITVQAFGPVPTCAWGTQPDLARATNYTDLWWAAPPGSESGWGINLTHQGTNIYATWFVYNMNSRPLWYSVIAAQVGPATYARELRRTNGPAYNSEPFDPKDISYVSTGTATFTFSDGNNATFSYFLINGFQSSGSKAITRQVFRPPGTVCQ